MTVSIEHTITLVTDLDESHPTAKMLLRLPKEEQIKMLSNLAKECLVNNSINELNEGNTWAVLKVGA
jgi:hypothetical protein